MSGIFLWAMRHGAKILFVVAILQFLIGLIPLIGTLFSETSHMAANLGYSPDSAEMSFGIKLQMLFAAIVGAAFPFFGALVIDRLDRWLAIKERERDE